MPPKTQDERAAVLQERFDHLEKRFEKVEEKIEALHSVLLQAKGARWAILGIASLIGMIGIWIGTWLPLFNGGVPK